MTGVLMLVPIRVLTRMSKSVSRGAAELQTGILMWTSPGNFSFNPSMTLLRVTTSLTSLFLSLVDVNKLKFASILLCASFNDLNEFFFISLSRVTSDISQLSILSNLVWWASTDGFTVDIDIWFLAEVEPDDLSILRIGCAGDLGQSCLKPSNGGLAAAVDLVSWNSAEVGASGNWIRELLDLLEVIGHGGGLPNFWIFSHAETWWMLLAAVHYLSQKLA